MGGTVVAMETQQQETVVGTGTAAEVEVDVVVVGGGAAGLSTALVLARSRRSVLVVDAGEPRNAPADAVHGYLGREGTPPLELTAAGRAEVEGYGASVVTGRVVSAEPAPDGSGEPRFRLVLDDGRRVLARRVALATGVRDVLPDVPGLAARWGRDVLHCPYCHGWEVRDRRVGVLATGVAALHQVGLFRQLTADVTLLAHGTRFSSDDLRRLDARGVRLVEGEVREVLVESDVLVGVRVGEEVVPLDALVVASFPDASSVLADTLGVATADLEMRGAVVARALQADPTTGATEVPGVVVVGNAAAPMATAVASAAAGVQAAAFLNAGLVEEDTVRALAALR